MNEKFLSISFVASLVAVPVTMAWYGLVYRPAKHPADKVVIEMTGIARRGVWTLETVHNLNYWWKTFEPATLDLPLKRQVLLRLHSADVVHQFYVPALGLGPVTVEPGHVSELEFRVTREGVFQYYCTSLCGECHFYMTGWIVVTAPGKTPPTPKPIVCELCLPEAPPPADGGVVAQGEYLYRRKGCGACHGPEGQGGVPNYNYLNDKIVDHVHMAERLFLRDEESARSFVDWIAASQSTEEPEDPDIDGFALVSARLNAAMKLIRDGKNAAKADLAGPDPPLQMPAWKHKLTDNEILSVMAYLISLTSWEEETEDHVVVNTRR